MNLAGILRSFFHHCQDFSDSVWISPLYIIEVGS